MVVYDHIIVGGGMAGLYCSYKIKGNNICLEADRLGGRASEREIGGETVKIGGGICESTNTHLFSLLEKFKINKIKLKGNIDDKLIGENFVMNDAVEKVKQMYSQTGKQNKSVDEYLLEYFGKEFTESYYKYSIYNDYKFQDINDYILRYTIDDEIRDEYEYYVFNYNELSSKLSTNTIFEKVNTIKKCEKYWKVNNYKGKKVIMCTTVLEAQHFFPNYHFLNQIGHVPFCRIYTYHTEKVDLGKGVILVNNQCKKIIKMSDHVVMSVYCDSENAAYWERKLSKDKILKTLAKKLPFLPPISEYLFAHWNVGVHYFKPEEGNDDNAIDMRKIWLTKNMNPEEGLYFAGEYFSERQGWVEGAISSVDFLIDNFGFDSI